MKAVSIIIPVYNAFDDALRCIKSVIKHYEASIELEVLVLDDTSSDGEFYQEFKAQGLSTLNGKIKVVRNLENLGFTKNINKGFKESGSLSLIHI